MKSKYLYTKTTVSLIRYHFVFCPRYRRKIFLVDGVEERFKQLTREICGRSVKRTGLRSSPWNAISTMSISSSPAVPHGVPPIS